MTNDQGEQPVLQNQAIKVPAMIETIILPMEDALANTCSLLQAARRYEKAAQS